MGKYGEGCGAYSWVAEATRELKSVCIFLCHYHLFDIKYAIGRLDTNAISACLQVD